MTTDTLVALITYLCINATDKVKCYEHYVNCSIGSNGIININKCVKYKRRDNVNSFDN